MSNIRNLKTNFIVTAQLAVRTINMAGDYARSIVVNGPIRLCHVSDSGWFAGGDMASFYWFDWTNEEGTNGKLGFCHVSLPKGPMDNQRVM